MKLELLNDDDIVISGVGCKVPGANNLSELAEQLLGKKISISENNQNDGGNQIADVKKFDFTFFGVSNMVARMMDPMTKHILERTFEAVIDAGINPSDIKGSNAFVFSGMSISDCDQILQGDEKGGYGIMAKSRCMNSNRVSYWLDLKGTSVAHDANYMCGLQNIVSGWESIRNGFCDTALVCTANIHSVADVTKQLSDLKKLSSEGKCKSYDDSADGWIRSDGVVVFVLQRAKIAKRCYAVIEHAMSKMYGDRQEILPKASQQYWEIMLNEFYAQSKIDLNDICYVEGDGTGVKEDDTEELNALTSVFCKNRPTPLLLGSIKSNIGHTEAASASCGILKAIVSLETGIIPKNLHYQSPNSSSPGLKSGKIQVVEKNIRIPENGLIAVNGRSISGMYGHVVLRANPKTKKPMRDGIPRLVPLSVRQDQYFDDLVEKLEAEPYDPEQIALLQDAFSKSMDQYLSRGYTILPKVNDSPTREHQLFDPIKRPLWFIFSGMGSQWPQMGRRLMDLPTFRESIEKSHEVLKKKGLNLIEIISTDDSKVFDNILNSFVGIAAVQIALVDTLHALGIVPDNMIGHSVGELGCSYADGCLTAEQTILCAYSRGKASIETPLIKGFMAAIGKGYNEIKNELPEGIEVACHNAADSCTISGPAELVQNYVKELQDRNIFARTVNVANIAYHSQYIKPAAPKLLEYLKAVIPEPKLRSEKWISTSILEGNWGTDLAKYCSAEYHTNNLLSSVYFEEGSRKIPKNAICIEIAPHGLLQAILKRSLGKDCVHIPLTNRISKDPLTFFLQALGKMYMVGINPLVQELYPKVEYPVSRGTPCISQFVRWQHDHILKSIEYVSEKEVVHSLKDRLRKTSKDGIGYLIDDNNYYPFSLFIVLIWEIFASSLKKELKDCPVVFEDIKAEKLVPVDNTESDKVFVYMGPGTGHFEIFTDHILASGTISLATDLKVREPEETVENRPASKSVVYEKFERDNYVIGKYFKNLKLLESMENVVRGSIPDSLDWFQTLESMIQLEMINKSEKSQSRLFPLSVESLSISPESHAMFSDSAKDSAVEIELLKLQNIVKCGGIKMKGLKLQSLPKLSSKLKFQSNQFVPFTNPPLKDLWKFFDYCMGIVKDNCKSMEINVLEVTNGVRTPSIASYLEDHFSDTNIKTERIGCDNTKNIQSKYDLVISSLIEEATSLLNDRGFIFALSPMKRIQRIPADLEVVTKYSINQDDFVLLMKKEVPTSADYIMIPDSEPALYNIVKRLKNESHKIIYLFGYSKLDESFQKSLHKETSAQIRWVFILDKKGPTFDANNPIFANQLRKGLTNNVYLNGSWGSFYQRNFAEEKFKVDSVFTRISGEITPAFFGTDADEYLSCDKFQVEYSGKLKNKTQVMGIASIRNKEFVADDILQWNIPSTWTLEDGATVPLSHSLVYYYLKIVSRLKSGESVLVTDGLSFNGQAAISVALALGLKVYVTVNDEKEILQVMELYPDIKKEDILIHDDGNFEYQLHCIVKRDSNPSVLINNLEEEQLESAFNILPVFGRIIHFGKKDLRKNTKIGMYIFQFMISIYGASSAIIDCLPTSEKKEIRDFIANALKNGSIKPLPRVVCNEETLNNKKVLETRTKKLFTNKNECRKNRLWIDPEKSYLIIDDESNFGLKISEWLIQQNARNIIISSQNPPFSKKSLTNAQEKIQRQLNIIVENGASATALLSRAKKLAPLAAVFCIKMTENSKSLAEMDKLFRDQESQLVLISKNDSLSELCTKRTNEGFISTNFIWKSKKELSHQDLNLMVELCGEDSVIVVSDDQNVFDEAETTKRILADTLPDSIQKFCDLGSSLESDARVIELPNLGLKNSEVRELSPIFIIPGLQDDPEKIVLPLSKKLMYPVFLVKLPKKSKEFSIEKLGSLISLKIQSANKFGKSYNILGLSWGSYLAMEVTRSLEKLGKNVSLMLFDVPQISKNMKFSLDKNLIDVIYRASNLMENDSPYQELSTLNIDNTIRHLNLPQEEAKYNLNDAINYIYNCLQAIFDYKYSDLKLYGPLTIISPGNIDKKSLLLKICDNTLVKNLLVNQADILTSKTVTDLIHGSAISVSMSDNAIHQPNHREFEKFLAEQKIKNIENDILMDKIIKMGFQWNFNTGTPSNTFNENKEVVPL